MDDLWQDLRYAARVLIRSRSFSLVAILTLALGIGATTAVFSVLHAVILNPLPFPEADRLVFLYGGALDTVNFGQWQQQARSYEHFAALSIGRTTLTGRGDSERLRTLKVTESMFSMLGVRPELGRPFIPSDRLPPSDRVVMASYRFWEERLGGSAAALGQVLVLDDKPHTIVGVLPREIGPLPYRSADLWLPVRPDPHYGLSAIARLRDGVSLRAARAEAETLAARFGRRRELRPGQAAIRVFILRDHIVGDYQDLLLVLGGAVGFVLLIGCANVANLLLARATVRARELAIRSALGASRWRIVRQTLTESFLLSVAGAAAGLVLAEWSVRALLYLLPYDIPRIGESRLSGIVLAFAMILLFLTTFLAGLAPALQGSSPDVTQAMKEGASSAGVGSGGRRLRRALVVTEVALAMVMLIGAGLLIKAFLVLRPSSPGFGVSNRLTAQIDHLHRGASYAEVLSFFRALKERLASLPGVRDVAGATDLPFTGESFLTDVTIDGKLVAGRSLGRQVHWRASTEDYFRVMEMQMVAGRDFAETDDERSEKVAIINQAMARRYWPNQDPVGRKVTLKASGHSDEVTIVGVVRDARIFGLTSSARPEVYQPLAQCPYHRLKLVIRTQGDPLDQAANVRGMIRGTGADVLVSEIQSMQQLLYDSVAEPRFQAVLLASLSGLALVLAVVGIHGVLTYSANQRTREMGIRMALGASRGQILKLLLIEGILLTFAGIAIGVGLAWWLARLMQSLLYEVQPTDLKTFIWVTLIWCAVALLACAVPARRATRVDPLVALRYE